jgi:hypothetical protein
LGGGLRKVMPKLKKKLTGSPTLLGFTKGIKVSKKSLLGRVSGFEAIRGEPLKKFKIKPSKKVLRKFSFKIAG